MGFDGKASYEWGGDIAGKVWVGGIHQRVEAGTGTTHDKQTAQAWEIGGKVNVGAFGLVGYYYDGENMGVPFFGNISGAGFGSTAFTGLTIGHSASGNKDHDVSGGYVQATFTAPFGTKFGASWGESNFDKNSDDGVGAGDYKDESWVVGAYHPLTKSLNLVAEYNHTKIENNGLNKTLDGTAKTISLGAILFF